jgi:hypothetical protein
VNASELKKDALITPMLFAMWMLASAQGPSPSPANPAVIGAKSPTPEALDSAPSAREPYAYESGGRRDPFVSLLLPSMGAAPGKQVAGLPGIPTADVMVRGVLQSRGSYVALLSGSDGKTYQGRVNDRLLDGVIRSVTASGIVIMQEVSDSPSLIKQREVRKGLGGH